MFCCHDSHHLRATSTASPGVGRCRRTGPKADTHTSLPTSPSSLCLMWVSAVPRAFAPVSPGQLLDPARRKSSKTKHRTPLEQKCISVKPKDRLEDITNACSDDPRLIIQRVTVDGAEANSVTLATVSFDPTMGSRGLTTSPRRSHQRQWHARRAHRGHHPRGLAGPGRLQADLEAEEDPRVVHDLHRLDQRQDRPAIEITGSARSSRSSCACRRA